jgi:hypothetical protein
MALVAVDLSRDWIPLYSSLTRVMAGETSRFTEDYGTLVLDVDHHGLSTFGEEDLAPESGRPSLTALALAARCSASFPGAFEPSFVPVGSSIVGAVGVPAHPTWPGSPT